MTVASSPLRGGLSRWHQKFIVEERHVRREARRRLYVTSAVLVAIGLIAFSILLVGVLTHTGVQRLDGPVELWFNAQRSRDTTGVMIALAVIFGPVSLPIIIVVVIVVWVIAARHLWRPLLLAGGMAAGVLLSQGLAPLVQHPRPPIGLMLFGPDRTYSFPSGHVLGTSDFLLIVAFLLASRIQRTEFTLTVFTVAIVGILAQIISRLYLGYHWISDTTASVALSMVILGTLIAVDTRRTARVSGEPVGRALQDPTLGRTA
jgi:membrane-associated phospholipid phosphatase